MENNINGSRMNMKHPTAAVLSAMLIITLLGHWRKEVRVCGVVLREDWE